MPVPDQTSQAEISNRPVGVTIFAILHLLFGASGLVIAISTLAFSAIGGAVDLGPIPLGDTADQPAYRLVTGVIGTLDLFLCTALVAAGLGLLKMRAWARQVSLVYAAYTIIAAAISSVVQYSIIYLPLIENVAGDAIGAGGASALGIVLAVSVACVGMTYPLAILFYFFRPGIRRKFAA
ncbi:MAG: hypothetical protein VYA84_06665 [Planctomycetota bacterium]|nr:hypothetical protein [Planctomycetota bacterium]